MIRMDFRGKKTKQKTKNYDRVFNIVIIMLILILIVIRPEFFFSLSLLDDLI